MSRFHRINLTDPLVGTHPLNIGRAAWLLTPSESGWSSGYFLRDLCKRFDGTITAGGSAVPQWATLPNGVRCLNWVTGGSTDGYVDIGGASSLSFTDNFSVACSFVTTTLAPADVGGIAGLVNKYNSVAGNEWFIRQHDAKLEFGGSTLIATGSILATNTLYRALAVMNAGAATIYLDGVSVATGAPAISAGSDTVLIGDGYLPRQARFYGRIGDVSVWSRPLSITEVLADFQLSRVGYRCDNSPLRWIDSRQIFKADGSDPLTFMDIAYGTDLYQEPGIRVFADHSRIYGDATGFGPIATPGVQYFFDNAVGTQAFAGEVPTLVAFADTAIGSDSLTAGAPFVFSDVGRGSELLTTIVNGNRKIISQNRFRR